MEKDYLAKGGVFAYTMSALQQYMYSQVDFLLLTVYFTLLLEHVILHPYWHLSLLVEARFVCLSSDSCLNLSVH